MTKAGRRVRFVVVATVLAVIVALNTEATTECDSGDQHCRTVKLTVFDKTVWQAAGQASGLEP